MTFENLEAVNATLLWINLKTGILPRGAAILPVRDNNPTDDVSRADRGQEQPARARVASLSMPTKRGPWRLPDSTESSGRRTFRLFPRLRLVWSRHEKSV
ncbi:MAG: hypothetical protein ACLQU2_35625 [Candidatus Binataceae bacterium]